MAMSWLFILLLICYPVVCSFSYLQLAEKDMLSQTSVDVFKDFVNQAISCVLDPKLQDFSEGSELISNLNVSLGKILLSGHQTNTMW